MILPYISPTTLAVAIGVSTALVLALLAIAAWSHRRARQAVPIRIHVAGSRGKTTTTRLLGSALREAGMRTLVKTTGTDPLLILPDGTERAWQRWAPPSISEQVRFFRLARKLGVDAVVLESMAIEPEYMWASEHYLVAATHAVITNARPDHAESLGNDPEAAARALALIVPESSRLYYSSEAAMAPIIEAAEQLVRRGGVSRQVETDGMGYQDANRALAMAVCTDLGIAAEQAMAGFERAGNDPGAFRHVPIRVGDSQVSFANAFACNDPASFIQLWNEQHSGESSVILINTRSDRPERTRAFLDTLDHLTPPASQVFLVGAVPDRWLKTAQSAGISVKRTPSRDPQVLLQILAEAAGPQGAVWGVGNYAGLGKRLWSLVQQKSEQPC